MSDSEAVERIRQLEERVARLEVAAGHPPQSAMFPNSHDQRLAQHQGIAYALMPGGTHTPDTDG